MKRWARYLDRARWSNYGAHTFLLFQRWEIAGAAQHSCEGQSWCMSEMERRVVWLEERWDGEAGGRIKSMELLLRTLQLKTVITCTLPVGLDLEAGRYR